MALYKLLSRKNIVSKKDSKAYSVIHLKNANGNVVEVFTDKAKFDSFGIPDSMFPSDFDLSSADFVFGPSGYLESVSVPKQ